MSTQTPVKPLIPDRLNDMFEDGAEKIGGAKKASRKAAKKASKLASKKAAKLMGREHPWRNRIRTAAKYGIVVAAVVIPVRYKRSHG